MELKSFAKKYDNTGLLIAGSVLLVLLGFYPYPGIPLRTDNFVFYIAWAVVFLKARNINFDLTIIFLVLFVVIGVQGFFKSSSFFQALAEFESYFSAVMAFILGRMLSEIKRAEDIIQPIFTGVVAALVINTIAILIIFFFTPSRFLLMISGSYLPVEESPLIHPISLSELILIGGRSGGFFIMPVDAGLIYCLGLLSWLALVRENGLNIAMYCAWSFLILGGLLCGSKVFMFIAPIIWLLQICFSRIHFPQWVIVLALTFFSYWILYIVYEQIVSINLIQRGLNYYLRYLNLGLSHSGSFASVYDVVMVDRLTGEKSVVGHFRDLWFESRIFGKGFGGGLPGDFGYLRIFAVGGLVGLFCVIGAGICLLVTGVRNAGIHDRQFNVFWFLLWGAVALAATLGSPAIVANKISLVWWLVLGLVSRTPNLPGFRVCFYRGGGC